MDFKQNLPAFGEIVPGEGGRLGGIVRGALINGLRQPDYAIIVSDFSSISSSWHPLDKSVKGAQSFNDGKTNTLAMCEQKSPAAIHVSSLEFENHKDYYIPSIAEIWTLRTNVPELFKPEWYWTSTQYNIRSAHRQNFKFDVASVALKQEKCNILACRQIPLMHVVGQDGWKGAGNRVSQDQVKQTHYLECRNERSSKFWEVVVNNLSVVVRFGKIGTGGQTQAKIFKDADDASKHVEKLVTEKISNGYLSTTAAQSGVIYSKKNVIVNSNLTIGGSSLPKARVARSQKVVNQVRDADRLRKIILKKSKGIFAHDFDSNASLFVTQLEMSAEAFDVKFKEQNPKIVDRSISMLSGPFFTSKEYPIPSTDDLMWYPVIQMDLRVASSLIQEALGNGLLQLWFDIRTNFGELRVIPRSIVTQANLTEFLFCREDEHEAVPLPWDWDSDPTGDGVRVMSSFKSTGIASQPEYLSIYLEDLASEFDVSNEFSKKVNEFERITERESGSVLTLFGTFYPIQYSAGDVGEKCLLNFNEWFGGNAQVFYKFENGQPEFRFDWSC